MAEKDLNKTKRPAGSPSRPAQPYYGDGGDVKKSQPADPAGNKGGK